MSQPYDSGQAPLYKQYDNTNSYRREEGIMIIPLASPPTIVDPGPPSKTLPAPAPLVIRLHQPYTIRVNSFSAVKEQTPPILPGATDKDVLLASNATIPLPEINVTGNPTYVYKAAGSYTYLSTVAYSSKTGYPAGEYPFKFPQISEKQTLADPLYGIANVNTTALGAIVGGFALSVQPILNANVPINTGQYIWPYTHLPKAFFNSELTQSI